MWSIESPFAGTTNKVVIPADGIINVVKPKGVEVSAYINDLAVPVHYVHVKAGDVVYFGVKGSTANPEAVAVEYAGATSYLPVAPVNIETSIETDTQEEIIMTPAETINLFANPGMGGMGAGAGAGLGAGLLGGVLGGALLGNRGLLGVQLP